MSELTKHSLTSIGTNKKEKQDKKVKRTVRFELPLLESNEQAYSQLNYKDLLISREKRDRQKSKDVLVLQNGFTEVASAEDAEMVRRLEEKYGKGENGGKKKKANQGRFENFADLGAGYDETDPFIDNTDAYDEVVPEQMTTAHGGFYINCGPLEFKQMSDQSDTEEPVNKVKRRAKRVLSIVEEDEEEEETSNTNNLKKAKADLLDDNTDISKKRKVSQDLQILKKKKKHAIDELTKKKSVTVKELLKEKRDTLEMFCSTNDSTKELKKLTQGGEAALVRTSITDAIESVVSGAKEEESSQDSSTSQGSKSTAVSPVSSDTEESQDGEDKEKNSLMLDEKDMVTLMDEEKEEIKLPENLSEDLKELIRGLEKAGKTTAEGKCKFFTTEINGMLLGVEKMCYILPSSSRNSIYKYLESYLPCTKDTLKKRAKTLYIKHMEDEIELPLRRLKAAIEAAMPAVLERYGKESQRVVQEKSVEESPSDGEEKPGHLKSKIPRKVFPWTKELRSLLVDIVEIKTRSLHLNKTRKESVDSDLLNFLDKEVKTLWPAGWMNVAKLQRQKEKKPSGIRKSMKQVSFAPKLPTVPSVTVPDAKSSSVSNSSNISSVSWSKTATTITPINSSASCTPHTSSLFAQVSSTAYSQPASVSLSVTTSTFPSVECSPSLFEKAPSNHSKSNPSVEKLPQMTSEIPNSISRTTTVIVPTSPCKYTSPETGTAVTSNSPLETSSPMSMINIPDCISVTHAVLPSQTPSANVSPPKPMSLKHRILHDAAIDLTNCLKPNPTIENVSELFEGYLPTANNKDVNILQGTSESHKKDITIKPKPSRRKKKDARGMPLEAQMEPKVEPPPPPPICEKETERRLLEETNAATSFISQIINESLQSFPNAATIRNNSICHKAPSPPRALSPPQDSKIGSTVEPDLSQSSKKKNPERRQSTADADMSVQMEVKRVLEELKELQGLSVGKTDTNEVDYSKKLSQNLLPIGSSLHMNALPIPKLNVDSLLKCNAITNVRSSPCVGFQDEFQKHISLKQEKPLSVVNSKPQANTNSIAYSQVNQPSVGLHSTIRHTPNFDSQSRNSNGSDTSSSYLKQSTTSEPFASMLFGGIPARNVLNSHFQDKSFDQPGSLPSISTFNPNTDDPFTMLPFGLKTDAAKNQHSSPC